MFKCKDILFIILFIYFFVSKAYAIEYKVKFNDTNFNNIKDFVNGIQSNGELVIRFIDDFYDFSSFSSTIDITVQSNITFIGNTNGTIFDFGKVPRGRLIFSYPSRGYTVKIENIIFENYSSTGLYDVEMMIINVYSDNYYFILNNCTFQNNYYRVIRIDTAINKWTHTHPSVIINNCNFYNNIEGVLKEIRYVINYSEDLYKTLYIQINNSTFINNKGLFVLQYGRLEINNCYFNEVEKNSMDNHEVVFIGNFNSHDDVFINNSKFEDIKIESLYPLINGENLNLRVENTSFLNCKSATGYLFHLKNKESLYKDQTIYFKNNTFQDSISIFHGDYNKIIIEDSIFKDTIYKNSLPAISDSKGSRFIISNTQFFNLSLSSSLFKEDSFYSLNKIKLTDITTNYIAVFQFFQNNVNIENMEVENIQCVGDTDRTSFLLYDSGEDKKTININNVSIKNSISNGPFIKIKGDISEINMNNVNIKSVRSYGSIIKDLSTKSIISISNSNFNENRNLNKLECGSIHFSNNLLLSIENSEFSNNHCQSNGGAICIDEIVSMDLNLISNIFSDNKSLNGGALYLKDSNNTISNNLSNIQIKNNIFRNNVVENFGGAIYSEYSNLYLAKTENNSIIYNSAGIIGGGIYSPFSINKNLFDINSFEIGNNTISGYINDYASKPSYITLNKKLDIKNKELRPGDYLPLIFTLYDEFDQLYNDIIKYYSMLSLNLDLVEINSQGYQDNDDEKVTMVKGNECYFTKGVCELSELQIFGKPNNYILEVKVKNYDGEIMMKFDPIRINILACDKYQIKMYKNGILSCEIPVCKDTCPISSTAICRPYINEFVNNKENNICECLSGWEGEYCEKKKLVNFGKLNKIIVLFESISIFIVVLFTAYIIINRDKQIIDDIGIFKILIFIVGIITYFISNYFITYTNYIQWMLYFCFKHFGIGIMVFIIYTIVSLSMILGVEFKNQDQEELERASLGIMLNSLIDENAILNRENALLHSLNNSSLAKLQNENSSEYNKNIESDILVNIINSKKKNRASHITGVNGSVKNIIRYVKSKSSISVSSVAKEESMKNEFLIITIDDAHSFFIETIFLYLIFVAALTLISIFAYFRNSRSENNIIFQKDEGYWTYKCITEDYDLFLSLLELIVFTLTVYKGIHIYNYRLIFRIVQHIITSSFIGIIFGPIINIIGFYFLGDMRYSQVIFNFVFNNIAYWFILIMFLFNIINNISHKEGCNIYAYFLSPLSEKCIIHKSFKCECVMKKVENYSVILKKYIEIYKFCYKIFIREDESGKLKLIDEKAIVDFVM